MPAWAGVLSDQDIADIHAWLKTLSEERNAE
jgi:mono/diheme cytochrome c family protein